MRKAFMVNIGLIVMVFIARLIIGALFGGIFGALNPDIVNMTYVESSTLIADTMASNPAYHVWDIISAIGIIIGICAIPVTGIISLIGLAKK